MNRKRFVVAVLVLCLLGNAFAGACHLALAAEFVGDDERNQEEDVPPQTQPVQQLQGKTRLSLVGNFGTVVSMVGGIVLLVAAMLAILVPENRP